MDRSASYWALIRRSDHDNRKLAIFIHGFRGSYLGTWGNLSTCLADLSDDDPVFREWDYLFLGYDTASIGNLLNIAELISSQWRKASLGEPPFRAPYETLALFGHSLGTLGIRQLLCATSLHPTGFTDALKAVALFGSPLNGSPLARFARLLGILDLGKGVDAAANAAAPSAYDIKEALRPDGAQIQMLRTWDKSMRQHIRLPGVYTYQGLGDWVVGPGKVGDDWTDDVRALSNLDHTHLSKINEPAEWSNSPLRDALKVALR